jgi:hypothetical protein
VKVKVKVKVNHGRRRSIDMRLAPESR